MVAAGRCKVGVGHAFPRAHGFGRRIGGLFACCRSAGAAGADRRSGPPRGGQGRPEEERASQKGHEEADQGSAKKAAPPTSGAYAGIPLAQRAAIQFDLIWTGDYNGPIDGEFSDRSITAVKAFQKDRGFRETGVLTAPERARSRRRRRTGATASAGAWSTIP